ncbi:thioredoxin-like isoform X2 [Chiloscyllium plagiosum]|uniref:thioredoxin-like isoform X2 n=1 Tax=Chiloscyllium plagiosum TaxID=36176 RepID=UPI001CB7FE0C|nr:thioredoxin-like isoform X2 [Chiloscyllium plagiosum]
MIYILEDENAFAEKMKEAGNKLVVIDFYADWCNPCQTVAKWYKDLVEKFNITTIPRILLFKDGKQIEIQDNNNDKNTLKKNIDLYKEVQCASNTK